MADDTNLSISVVGLGKLGSCLAATLAEAGFPVSGADLDSEIVETINAGEAPFPEPKLQEYITAAGDDFQATTDTREAITDTDVSFIIVNTPSQEDGTYSLDAVSAVSKTIGEVLAEKDDYHLVVLTSTVSPRDTEDEIIPILEKISGKVAGDDFGVCYSPEFIAIGDVITGLEDPDFFLVGEHTERAGDILTAIYEELGEEETPVARMSTVEAELAKISVNAYVTAKISFANTLGQISDGVGADVDVVTDSLAMDGRINGNYFSAGGRFGGPCFPRDNDAFAQVAEQAGTRAPLAESTDEVNDLHTDWIADIVRDHTPAGGTVAILGLSYKPGTYIIKESQGTRLVEKICNEYEIICYDPMGIKIARERFGTTVEYAENTESALATADTAVVSTPWPEFEEVVELATSTVVIDIWRQWKNEELSKENKYVPIGSVSKNSTKNSVRD